MLEALHRADMIKVNTSFSAFQNTYMAAALGTRRYQLRISKKIREIEDPGKIGL
jgi:hypothetical protein